MSDRAEKAQFCTCAETNAIGATSAGYRCPACESDADESDYIERDQLVDVLARPSVRDALVDLIEETCPHEADRHPEGFCEVCDYAFALVAALDGRLEDE